MSELTNGNSDMIDKSTRAKELAEAHWGYVRGILEAHGIEEKKMKEVAYHYPTAFVHGYKHAIEDFEEGFYSE